MVLLGIVGLAACAAIGDFRAIARLEAQSNPPAIGIVPRIGLQLAIIGEVGGVDHAVANSQAFAACLGYGDRVGIAGERIKNLIGLQNTAMPVIGRKNTGRQGFLAIGAINDKLIVFAPGRDAGLIAIIIDLDRQGG